MVVATPIVSNVAVVSIQAQDVSLQMIADELKEWGLEGLDWQLQQISPLQFAVVFPSTESMSMISKSTSFTLPINKLVVLIKAASDTTHSVASLVETWVLFDDVPDIMCYAFMCMRSRYLT